MVVSILHRGLENPEILWRRNLRAESLKLGAELRDWHPDARTLERIAAGIISPHERRHFERVMLRGRMREELTKSFRDGFLLAQMGPISAITNYTSSVTYATIKDAIYLASSGDEIILPAGSGATYSGTFTRYSNFGQLNSWPGYSGDSSNQMVFGYPDATSNPSLYAATYLSVVGIASTNSLSSVSWANTSGGQLTVVISGSLVTTYRRGQYVRISGATNTGTGGASSPGLGNVGSINNIFTILSASGSTLVLNAPASSGVYGTIGGSPVLNNDRAQISTQVGYLVATLNPGDTTIQLDDAADFDPSGGDVYAWGNGDGTWQSIQMGYTGVSGNNLTGVTSSGGLSTAVPVGNPILSEVNKALFTPAATNSTGITMSNLEIWGAASYPSGGGIFQWVNTTIGGAIGSLTLSNMFFHDNELGIRPGNSSVGAGVFLDIFNSEFWRNGLYYGGLNHNLYVEADTFTMQNCLSWQNTTLSTGVSGAHLVKSRSRVNYMLQNRTLSDHGTTTNPGNTWSSNYDFPNGGEIYLIGCELASSLHDSVSIIRHGEEMSYPQGGIGGNANNGAANPLSAIYVVNCDGLAPSDGIGTYQTNDGPIAVGWPGLKNPEMPTLSTTSGGSLPARTYWFATTCLDSGGNESLPSCMSGGNAFVAVMPQISIGANNLAVVASPLTRTGAVTYNVYAAHADPTIWWDSAGAVPPATGPNQFFYDSAFTEPVCAVNSGGSQSATFVYVGITYVFPEGESVNFATSGNDLRFPSSSPLQVNAAVISVPANNLLTIKSPPAVAGATGWYPYVYVTTFSGSGAYSLYLAPLSRQVWTPIAIGTDWVQSGAFQQAETFRYNFYKQNSSPITMGTGWTEPTSGLTNLNPNLLKWYRRGNQEGGAGFSRWFAKATAGATNYVVNVYTDRQDGNYYGDPLMASIQVWSGTSGPFPFDADYPAASLTTTATATTATTAASHTVIFASFRNSSTAGAGWTQGASLSAMMSEYQVFSSPQTSLAVTQVGGGSTSILVDAITGTSLTMRGSVQSFDNADTNAMSFTIPTIASGDFLCLDVVVGNGPTLLAIDPLAWGPPSQNQALANSPVGLIINNAFAYYNITQTGGGYIQTFPGDGTLYPGVGYPTISSYNLQVNAYNGSGFNAPLVGAVWNGAPNFDFTLAGGSPLIGAGTNPGSGGGFSLVPTYQTSMNGPPTPGYPIATLTSRTDNGVTLGALQSGAPVPSLRLRWMRFGWDWKTIVTLGAAVLIENPTVSRRNVLLLQQQDGGASGENTAGPRPHNKGTASE